MTLPCQEIQNWITKGNISKTGDFGEKQIQPASLDCTLGNKVYRVASSFLPKPNETISEIVQKRTFYEFELKKGTILEPNASYIIPLNERIKIPRGFSGYNNPKSSIGRIDVFVRLLVDGSSQFDFIPENYNGPLYLEVIPLTFVVSVSPGISLNQIRFRKKEQIFLTDKDLSDTHKKKGLVYNIDGAKLENPIIRDNAIFLTADLKNREIIGFKAKHNAVDVIDLTKKNHYDPDLFWEPLVKPANGEFILVPGEFYLLGSDERVSIPPEFSAEMMSYDPQSGEMRAHYAGFFDSGFGFDEQERMRGTTAVLEVRAHNVPFRLTHGQIICRMVYERMSGVPDYIYGREINSNYSGNAPKLPKFFKNIW